MEASGSLINKIYNSFCGGLHFATPILSLRTNEVDLVHSVLRIMQGFSSSLFYWDHKEERIVVKNGIYVMHLSQTSLHGVLDQFTYAATCLRLVENVVTKVEKSPRAPSPTLKAFTSCVSAWLKRLRDVALKEEENINKSDNRTTPTLLGLSTSLSSLCAGAEFLFHVVNGAIPQTFYDLNSSKPAAEIAAHILNYLYKKLTEVCVFQGGEEDAYRMLLFMFAGSLLPYIEGLDSWLFEGILDDPFEEMFFYANKGIAIDEAAFWEKSYLQRSSRSQRLGGDPANEYSPSFRERKDSAKAREGSGSDFQVCPLIFGDMAKMIISAGKSLQLIQHSPITSSVGTSGENVKISGLTLSEIFCLSLAALVGYGDHISGYFWQDSRIISSLEPLLGNKKLEISSAGTCSDKVWWKCLIDTFEQKRGLNPEFKAQDSTDLDVSEEKPASNRADDILSIKGFLPENPAVAVCQKLLNENSDAWSTLNIYKGFSLPPLNDEGLRQAIFGGNRGQACIAKETNYAYGFLFSDSEHLHFQEDAKVLEALFPFPTLLPSFQEDLHISEVLPFQKNSTLPSRILDWVPGAELKVTLPPMIILQECLVFYIKKQADYIGRNMLSKLLCDWRLLDELAVLRAIYLLGSGDLLQHFLTVIFNKLDKGEPVDDDFELNTILQESIRNSADSVLLSTPESLVVSITKSHGSGHDEKQSSPIHISSPHRTRGQSFGINVLDSLKFTYKVSWPLELIANLEAIKKYNQVMNFLLKIKRAKFVLDKARRWMWKDRGAGTASRKRHWLLEQKLLHFVDAFHQYVMDRVYHSAWYDLCEGVAAAKSLDEVIEVHEAYLLTIQRQCFVVPDKLWALIANRINTILGLALDFYSVQQTLYSGGAVSAIKVRCEMELDRILKQFDDCIAFLLRILSFKLNIGQFPHLADLVTRINYNYFYMSNSGNLRNAPGPDSLTSKLGRAFSG